LEWFRGFWKAHGYEREGEKIVRFFLPEGTTCVLCRNQKMKSKESKNTRSNEETKEANK